MKKLSTKFLSEIFVKARKQLNHIRSSPKFHDYSKYTQGLDYFFEPAQDEQGWYLTSQGTVDRGDRIILLENGELCSYEVVEIDYYSDRPDTFISRLTKLEAS